MSRKNRMRIIMKDYSLLVLRVRTELATRLSLQIGTYRKPPKRKKFRLSRRNKR